MNILELDSYNLADAVKFNKELNPKLWGPDEKLRPQVREQLLKIAQDFREFLGVSDLELKDITLTGSNAAYTYTPFSDIDLHLVVDLPQADSNEVYRELFDAKKYQYNDMHDYKIGRYDIELYVENANKKPVSQGIYSVLNNDWVDVPKRQKAKIDDVSTKNKYQDLSQRIDAAVKSGSLEQMTNLANKIKDMRKSGLDAHGEFGPENLAFKMLRTQGQIKKLYDARNAAKDRALSIKERKRPGSVFTYGFKHESKLDEVGLSPDGTNPTTCMVVNEQPKMSDREILEDFVDFCMKQLKIEQRPIIKLRRDPQWPQVHKTFGRYRDDSNTLEVAWGNRHIMDVLRTVAHELTHKHQHEREQMPASAGETGSEYENEANARAGVLMRDWARLHPEHFSAGQADELTDIEEGIKEKTAAAALAACLTAGGTLTGCATNPSIQSGMRTAQDIGRTVQTAQRMTRAGVQAELDQELRNFIRAQGGDPGAQNLSTLYKLQKRMQKNTEPQQQNEGASGYIPTKKQARDPRFKMALTKDIRPGQLGKEANKLKLKTDSQGHPQQARTDGLFENLMIEYQRYKAAEDYSPDTPPGPEFRPTMPAGTLRVDVSDVYDWYKLGQHISNMKGLGKHDFGAGPPSSIISFGDEDTEHKFIDQIRATGLDVTDIDPADPKKRPGRTIKTDPTYNVDEAIQAPVSKQDQAADDYYRFIVGKIRLGRVLNRQEQEFLKMYNLKKKLAEFAPSPDRGDDGQGSDYLTQLANRWWNAADPRDQQRIADVIRTFGYEITQVESEDDAVQLTDIKGKADPIFISADEFDPDLFESADLDEVKMSPSALEKFAASPEARGIRAGFEAELIFRDTQGEADEMDPEPDYDADERAYSIDQVVNFFANDEYGYGLSDRAQSRLMDDLDEKYLEWRDELITSEFRNEAEDLIRERLLEETPMSERIQIYLTDSEQMSDEQADRIVKAGADAPRFKTSAEQQAYAEQNPDYKTYLDAADAAEEELEESVEYSVNKQDGYWDEALDDFRDNWSGDDDSFFSDVGLRWMSDIANEYNLDWPVWNMDSRGNSGSRDWEEIGNSLQAVVDMPVKVSTNYHSTARREGQWIIEPDGSLDPDDKSEEAGLEIVSPPMPLLTAIEKLRQVTDWANDPNGGNAYTNSSTGLHMGVSLPSMKSEAVPDDIGIDYVKLILFLGDKYVLQKFGREANTYTASALEKFKQNIRGKKSDPAGVVELLRHGLTELAHRELQKGVGTSKYTSAHIQPGYVEFRSPGGDWLAKADEEIGVLENTMMRFARAMQIAGDPGAERQEYAKKLYKLVTTDNEQYADQLRLFSEFSAGTINKEQLKKQWADAVLQKELPSVGKEEYEVYRRDNGDSPDATVGTLYARDYDDAYDQFLRQYGRDINNLDVRIKQPWFDVFDEKGNVVKTIRAKDVDKATERAQYEFGERWTDGWNIYRRPDDTPEPKASPRAQVAKRIVKPKPQAVGDDDASDWEAVYKPTGRVFDTLAHADTSQALAWRDMVMRSHGFDNVSDILVRRVGHQQAADARRDSVDLQRNLGVQDVDIDVTQNFDPSAYERNSERIAAIQAQAQQPGNWEIYQSDDPSRVVNTLIDATERQVQDWLRRQETQGMPPGFLSARRQTTTESWRSSIGQAIANLEENFADGKVKGKSRPGRVKRAGASCKGSVTDLRARAKKYGGEKGRMYHWCANMKSGRKK